MELTEDMLEDMFCGTSLYRGLIMKMKTFLVEYCIYQSAALEEVALEYSTRLSLQEFAIFMNMIEYSITNGERWARCHDEELRANREEHIKRALNLTEYIYEHLQNIRKFRLSKELILEIVSPASREVLEKEDLVKIETTESQRILLEKRLASIYRAQELLENCEMDGKLMNRLIRLMPENSE